MAVSGVIFYHAYWFLINASTRCYLVCYKFANVISFFFSFLCLFSLLRPVIVRRPARYPRKTSFGLFHGLKLLTFYSQNKLSDLFIVCQPNLSNTTAKNKVQKRNFCHKSTPSRMYITTFKFPAVQFN